MSTHHKYGPADEAPWAALLKEGNIEAYEHIYNRYWSRLYAYAYNRLKDKAAAEEIIQEVFFSLWMKHATLDLTHSLSAYLFTAVKYQLFNYIRTSQVRQHYARHFSQFLESTADSSGEEDIEAKDLKAAMDKEVEKLPEKCRQIFRMSRQEHRSIHDIAATLNISHKTVENHLTKALRQLRIAFLQHLWWLVCLFLL